MGIDLALQLFCTKLLLERHSRERSEHSRAKLLVTTAALSHPL
jgi:hypothetical protein